MAVPAANEKFDGTYLYRSGDRVNQYGALSQVTLFSHRCLRANYTSNPFIMIDGIVPWRKASNYRRLVITANNHEGFASKTGSHQTLDGYISSTQSEWQTLFTYPLQNAGNSAPLLSERNQARTECLLKLKQSKVNVGTFLAEARSSAEMLADASINLFKLLLAVKRGQGIKRIKKAFGVDLANGYLSFKYGWSPLCSDIYQLYKEAQEALKPPLILSGRRTVSSNYSSGSGVTYWTNRSQDIKCKHTCVIHAQISKQYLSRAASMGLINPLSLTWELIPLSFVVDWAMPIGNYLEALTAPAGLTFVDGFESHRFEGSISADRAFVPLWTGTPQSVDIEYFSFQREKLSSFPAPLPYVKSPFSTSNMKSALALFRQLRF